MSKRCPRCDRAEKFFDGCSRVECPERKQLTAAPVGDPYDVKARGVKRGGYVPTSHGLRREPTNDE